MKKRITILLVSVGIILLLDILVALFIKKRVENLGIDISLDELNNLFLYKYQIIGGINLIVVVITFFVLNKHLKNQKIANILTCLAIFLFEFTLVRFFI